MRIVEGEIGARERAFTQTGSHAHGTSAGLPTVTALMAGDGKPKCCYCRQNHSSALCKTVTDVTQRTAILKKSGRCFVCLKRHHMSRDCRSSVSCYFCNGRHHSSICKRHDSSSQSAGNSVNNSAPPRTSNNSTNPPPVSSGHTPTTTAGLYSVNGDIPVLLQTAQAYIHRPTDPACGMIIRLMFEGGVKGHISVRELRRRWGWRQNVLR